VIVPISIFFSSLILAGIPHDSPTAPGVADSLNAPSRCEEILNQPTRDSAVVRLVFSAFKFRDQPPLPPDLASLLAQGIKQFFILPRPLRLSTYQPTDSGVLDPIGLARRTIEGVYMLVLHRDGRISRSEVLGGTADVAFDRAIQAAVFSLDTSGLFLPLPPKYPADSVFIPFAIWPGNQDSDYRRLESVHALDLPTEFLSFKVPIDLVDSLPRALPHNRAPLYPPSEVARGEEGKVFLRLAVDTTGRVDPRTVLVLSSTSDAFTRAIGGILPEMRFRPLVIRRCKAKAMETIPFDFRINR